jgi:hypothetical protein
MEKSQYLGKKYLFLCRNQKGYYYLVDWQELPNHEGTDNKCHYQAPNCQQVAQFEHTLKLGSVAIDKQ